ncbi:hypothetical protein ABPG72_014437 [Tetrahymena utriculariae]
MSLYDQLQQLNPLFRQFGSYLHCLDDKIQYELYLKFRNVFKDFKEGVSKKISLESKNAIENPEKMKEIKDSIDNVVQDLNSLCQNIYEESKKYLIWVDTFDNIENKNFLFELQLKYSPILTVQFYSDVEKFKSEFQKYYGLPVFLIMSGQVANDYSYTDKKLFNYIKGLYNQNKQQVRIKGILIYTSEEGVKYMKDKFEKDDSELVKIVTYNSDDMLEVLNKLISHNKFCRVLDPTDLSYLFESKLKFKLASMHKSNPEKCLLGYNPQEINLKQIFVDAQVVMKEKNINFIEKVEFDHIFTQINKIFQSSSDKLEIAKQLLKLYTKEDYKNQNIQYYQLINNILNTLNEDLIKKMMPLIEMLQVALYTYDDSSDVTSIKKGSSHTLYRGTSIPQQNYQNQIKVNQFICLPSFSSFTSDQQVAINFIFNNKFDDTRPCLFIYEHSAGSQQFEFRPKNLKNISEQGSESEFLTYPFVTYKIIGIIEGELYSTVNLTLN